MFVMLLTLPTLRIAQARFLPLPCTASRNFWLARRMPNDVE
jgi:hypothetical protein